MDIRKLISKFLTNLCEKNYSQANEQLKQIVEAKVKTRVAALVDAKEKKENPFAKKTKEKVGTKTSAKKKLSKEENKKRFLAMVKNKKKSTKGK